MNCSLTKSLKSIPFLKLSHKFDFAEIKREVLNNQCWYDYVPPYFEKTPELIKIHSEYKHCALTTVNPAAASSIVREHFAWWKSSNNTALQHYYDIPACDRIWYATELIDKFPVLYKTLLEITDRPILCKIVRSGPGHSLGWHSHQNDALLNNYNKPEQCILHIPIVTNEEVVHVVRTDFPSDRYTIAELSHLKNDSSMYLSNFTEGNIWFFNSYYPHAYKNFSSSVRYDLLIYNDMSWNPKLTNLMMKEISKYSGPLVEEACK